MAPKAEPQTDDAPTLSPGDDPIPVEEIVRRGVTAGGRRLLELTVDLTTGRLSCVYDLTARGASAAVPPSLPPLSELAREILQVLEESPGEWLKGPEIAVRISDDVDAGGGSFHRAMAELRKAGLIESQTRNGYKRR